MIVRLSEYRKKLRKRELPFATEGEGVERHYLLFKAYQLSTLEVVLVYISQTSSGSLQIPTFIPLPTVVAPTYTHTCFALTVVTLLPVSIFDAFGKVST